MIERIRTFHLEHSLDKPFGFSQWFYDKRHSLIIEITDSSGAIGYGECYGPASVIQTAIDKIYAPIVMGEDPLMNEVIWQKCWKGTLDFAVKGIMMGAISGIDMALFDLKGKLLNSNLSILMGGNVRRSLVGYATGMYFDHDSDANLIKNIITEAEGYIEAGFTALKIKIGKNTNFDKALIKEMRESFPNIQLMADANHGYDINEAIVIGRHLEENNYLWFEEPLSPTQLDLYSLLSGKLDIAISAGESEQTRWGFQKMLASKAVTIIQPDMAYCGGPSEALKIRSIASSYGINTVPHCWGTQLNLACAAHFLSTSMVEPGRKEEPPLMLEIDHTPNPLRDEIFNKKVTITDGYVEIPDGHGLGVEVDLDATSNFCVHQTEQVYGK